MPDQKDGRNPNKSVSASTRYIFGCPSETRGAIATIILHPVPETDLHLCAKFQPNLFSGFGGYASRTDRQTDSKLNIKKLRDIQRTKCPDCSRMPTKVSPTMSTEVSLVQDTLEVHGSARQRHPWDDIYHHHHHHHPGAVSRLVT